MLFQENIPLKPLSNYRIGGPARYFFEATTTESLIEALAEAKKMGLPTFILAGGTNILFPDETLNKIVIKPEISKLEVNGDKIIAGSGILMSALLDFAARNNLSGLEWAGGLPGTLGGAVRGNAGCFKGEIKDSVDHVWSVNAETLEIKNRKNIDCEFSYRDSVFKKAQGKEIILETTLSMCSGKEAKIREAVNEKIDFRKNRHPLEYPNIGSIFKNVPLASIPGKARASFTKIIKNDPFPVIPAAYFISEAGLKGFSIGGAMVSEKHANFIVNFNNARSADVKDIIQLVKTKVFDKHSIKLEEEIEIL